MKLKHENTLSNVVFQTLLSNVALKRCFNLRPYNKDAFENEIRQVLGDTYEAHDLGDSDIVITGSHGIMLVAGSPLH